ncbi:MAG TPA: hypothetical protein VI248_17790 [Kineosporiaceae bacterium]
MRVLLVGRTGAVIDDVIERLVSPGVEVWGCTGMDAARVRQARAARGVTARGD